MNRSSVPFLTLLTLSACATQSSSGTNDPNAGAYDGYYGEGQGGGAVSDGSASDGNGPKPRTVVGTRGSKPRTGVALELVAKKRPRDPDAPAAPPRKPLPALGVAAFVPTAAGPGSIIEIFGGGFVSAPAGNTVKVGGVAWKVTQASEGVLRVEVPAGAKSGPISVSANGKTVTSKHAISVLAPQAFGIADKQPGQGLAGNVYKIPQPVTELPAFDDLGEAFAVVAVDVFDISSTGFAGFPVEGQIAADWYAIHFKGSLNVLEAGEYDLCLTSDDGSQLYIDETPVIDNDGVHEATEKCALVYMEPGEYQADILYFQGTDDVALRWTWAKDGGEKVVVPMTALFPPAGLADMGLD